MIIFKSSFEKKYVSLKEYVSRMKDEQKAVYYACGETEDKIAMLPQVESVAEKGYEVLYLTEDVDEFALKILDEYEGKKFQNVCTDKLDIATDEEKESIKRENEDSKELLDFMKEAVGGSLSAVRFTNALKNHPVSLSSEGEISVEMEKVLSKMPGAEANMAKAQTVMEINSEHPVAKKLKELYATDKDKVCEYAKILYAQARLIAGLTVENPAELSMLVCNLMI